MSKTIHSIYSTIKDPFLLQCCLPTKQQPYIGVDTSCNKNALFCIHHTSHTNTQGLMHQMMPLRQFKRKLDQKRFSMQKKVTTLVQQFSDFMDKLILQIKQLKLKKCLQLSMLWLRDISTTQSQYDLIKRIYRMDYQNITCSDIYSVYFKIIHNQQLFNKDLEQLQCYKGICSTLNKISDKPQTIKLLSEKLTQIQGILNNGQLLQKYLPDYHQPRSTTTHQLLLQQPTTQHNYQILYNKAKLLSSSSNYKPLFSKYPITPHITYHINIKTKYSNIMLGICQQQCKSLQQFNNLHHSSSAITFNLSNGNTYKDGMFISGSATPLKNLIPSTTPIKNQTTITIKLRLTPTQLIIMASKHILMRTSTTILKTPLYLILQSRVQQDSFQIFSDNQITSDNLKFQQLIKKYPQPNQSILPQQPELQNNSITIQNINQQSPIQCENIIQQNVESQKNIQIQINHQKIPNEDKLIGINNQNVVDNLKFMHSNTRKINNQEKFSHLSSSSSIQSNSPNMNPKQHFTTPKIPQTKILINNSLQSPNLPHLATLQKQQSLPIFSKHVSQKKPFQIQSPPINLNTQSQSIPSDLKIKNNQSQVLVKSISDQSDINFNLKPKKSSKNPIQPFKKQSDNMSIKFQESRFEHLQPHQMLFTMSQNYQKINSIKTPPKIQIQHQHQSKQQISI